MPVNTRKFLKENLLTILTCVGVLSGVFVGSAMKGVAGEKLSKRTIMYIQFPGELFLRQVQLPPDHSITLTEMCFLLPFQDAQMLNYTVIIHIDHLRNRITKFSNVRKNRKKVNRPRSVGDASEMQSGEKRRAEARFQNRNRTDSH